MEKYPIQMPPLQQKSNPIASIPPVSASEKVSPPLAETSQILPPPVTKEALKIVQINDGIAKLDLALTLEESQKLAQIHQNMKHVIKSALETMDEASFPPGFLNDHPSGPSSAIVSEQKVAEEKEIKPSFSQPALPAVDKIIDDAHTIILTDPHGQLDSAAQLMVMTKMLDKQGNTRPGKKKYLFLGDFVARGPHSLEMLEAVMTAKKEQQQLKSHKISESVVKVLVGNHELQHLFFPELPINYKEEVDQKDVEEIDFDHPDLDNISPETIGKLELEDAERSQSQLLHKLLMRYVLTKKMIAADKGDDFIALHAGIRKGLREKYSRDGQVDIAQINRDFVALIQSLPTLDPQSKMELFTKNPLFTTGTQRQGDVPEKEAGIFWADGETWWKKKILSDAVLDLAGKPHIDKEKIAQIMGHTTIALYTKQKLMEAVTEFNKSFVPEVPSTSQPEEADPLYLKIKESLDHFFTLLPPNLQIPQEQRKDFYYLMRIKILNDEIMPLLREDKKLDSKINRFITDQNLIAKKKPQESLMLIADYVFAEMLQLLGQTVVHRHANIWADIGLSNAAGTQGFIAITPNGIFQVVNKNPSHPVNPDGSKGEINPLNYSTWSAQPIFEFIDV